MIDETQKLVRDRILELLRQVDLDPTNFARLAGVAPSTLTRFINSPLAKHTPSSRTLLKLEKAAKKYLASGAAADQADRSPRPASRKLGLNAEQHRESAALLDGWRLLNEIQRDAVAHVIKVMVLGNPEPVRHSETSSTNGLL